MEVETPGSRIRAKRVQLGMTQERLAGAVGLNPNAIKRIEAGLITIPTIADYLAKMALELETTEEFIREGDLPSERSTLEQLRRLREEGIVRSQSELQLVADLAMVSLKKRRNANIPLSREELLVLIEVIRGSDGL